MPIYHFRRGTKRAQRKFSDYIIDLYRLYVFVTGSLQSFLSGYPPEGATFICPNFSQLNPNLFKWTKVSSFCLGLAALSALLRFLASRQLQKRRTTKGNKRSQLVTWGLYKYIQHPSYTAAMIIAAAILGITGRQDGIIGCWLPKEMVQETKIGNIHIALWLGALLKAIGSRVHEKETKLDERYGRAWKDYFDGTSRFIPLYLFGRVYGGKR